MRQGPPPPPTLVLLPGMDGTGRLFKSLVSVLTPEVDTIVVSYPADIPLNYDKLEALARRSLPVDRSFILLGESFSGPIAISLTALRFPQQVGLILCSTFAKNPRPTFSLLKGLIPMLPIESVPFRWISGILLGRYSTANLRSARNEAITQVTRPVMQSRLQSVLEVDVSAKLARLDLPILYLRASKDWVVPKTTSIHTLQTNPKVQEVTLRAPHYLLQAIPEEAAKSIRYFMKNINIID